MSGLDLEILCGVGGKRSEGLGCGVGEGDVVVDEGDEATTTRACSVVSKCCVSRKFGCVVSLCELSFLDESNVYVVLVEQLL